MPGNEQSYEKREKRFVCPGVPNSVVAVWFTVIITWFPIIVTRWLRQPPNSLEARDTMSVNRGDDDGKQYRRLADHRTPVGSV